MESFLTLSVALCTHNGAAYLPAQLESISSQTRLPDELVVCDDHSTDATVDIIKQFAATAPFPVRLFVNENNLGVLKNFEKAISLCECDIIALSDQDDVWFPAKLKSLGEVFINRPKTGMVFTDAELVDEKLKPLGYQLWDFSFTHKQRRLVRQGQAVGILLGVNFVTGATLAFRSKLRATLLPIPTNTPLLHDGWIALVAAAMGEISFVPEPLIMYRQHNNQLTGLGFRAGVRQTAASKDGRTRSEILDAMAGTYLLEFKRLQPHLERIVIACRNHDDLESISRIKNGIAYHYGLIDHYRNRARITSTQTLDRLLRISKELLNSGYSCYSKGVYSAARDLVL